jgi:hypothetical protein
MSMIFPGMDPYLEHPAGWQGVHNSMVVYIRDQLQPQLLPRFVASLEARVFVETPSRDDPLPDVFSMQRRRQSGGGATAVSEAPAPKRVHAYPREMNEAYVEILDRQSGQAVVAVIELVSPTNKYAGTGRKAYLDKQEQVLKSTAHLVEIDLLRNGPSVVAVPEYVARAEDDYDYLVSVNRAEGLRENYDIYPIHLRDRLPVIGIPLAEGVADARLDLQAVMERTWETGAYDGYVRYDLPCRPPLAPDDQAWADALIRAADIAQSKPQVSS